jgi:hypothetical protein
MSVTVILTCPVDGDLRISPVAMVADLDRQLVLFTCPICEDLVRHSCREEHRALLERAVQCGAPLGSAGPLRRPDICDGRPLTSIEAFDLHVRLGRPGALEAAMEAL